MQNDALAGVFTSVARRYPSDMIDQQMRDVPRVSFNLRIALDAISPKPTAEVELCDLGGGVGIFTVGCAAYGLKRTVLVDDFDDSVNHRVGSSILDLHRGWGVEVITRDVIERGIGDIPGAFDVITTFDSMEHWHDSPKRLFHTVVDKLKPGGVFILGVPNCVNLRKRLTIPFGIGKWSSMQDWYEAERFRGHVREPDVGDLVYITADMGLTTLDLLGRNWLGYYSSNPWIRLATGMVDRPLRRWPQLCSDIYVVARKG